MLMSNKSKGVFITTQKGSLSDIFDEEYAASASSVKPPYLIATCGSGVGIIQVTSKSINPSELTYLSVNISFS